MKIGPSSMLAALPMFVAGAAFAASEDGHREHGAHEHGRGTLDVAVEGEELVAELRMPAVNVIGFEHAPGTDAEREAVRQALARFKDPAAVLVPSPDAECEPEQVEAGFPGMGPGGPREHHDEDEHEHEHDDDGQAENKGEDEHHGHDEHDDDGHEPGEPGMEAHSELHATYHFHCHAPERLDRIQVHVFELLHDAEEIEVRVVTPTLQKAMDLHPGETVVELSR